MRTTTLRRRARVAAVLLLAGGSALSWVPAASAVTVDASGWWWRPNDSALPVEVPPRADVGTDQLLVEGEPEGATAVAAVKFTLAEGETSPILTLTPTPDSVLPPNAVVLACRVGSAWQPAEGGKWQAKPIADCFSSVQGIVGDGGTITFALTPLQSGKVLEVVIVPGVDPAAANDNARFSAFSLKFTEPTSADLKTSSGDGGFSSVGGDFASPDPASFGAESDGASSDSSFDSGSSSFDPSSASFDSGGGSSSTSFGPAPAFSQPSTFSAPTAVAPAASPALSASEQAGPTGVAPLQAAPAADTGAPPTRGRTLGILVLLAGAALGFWAYTGSAAGGGVAVAPVAPVPGAEPVVGGLGRFARPRVGPPPSLS